MPNRTTLTIGFSGFESDSVWFPPVPSGADADPLADAGRATQLAASMLAVGCRMARKACPELASELAALEGAQFSLDFFEYEQASAAKLGSLGWYRVCAIAPGASTRAVQACEDALGKSGAPLLAARAGARLAAFARAQTDELPHEFAASARDASAQATERFESIDLRLAGADLLRLRSADGSCDFVACMASCCPAQDPLADFKTFAKLAMASMEARAATGTSKGADAFFHVLEGALGAREDAPMARRRSLFMPQGLFFHAPSSISVVEIGGLPSDAFDEFCKTLLPALAQKFGTLAATFKGLGIPGSADLWRPEAAELAALSGLFSKLPPFSQALGAEPARRVGPFSPHV